ncbi:MAG TPA: flagellar hook-length control protein FliK [Thermaerobacter sp.]
MAGPANGRPAVALGGAAAGAMAGGRAAAGDAPVPVALASGGALGVGVPGAGAAGLTGPGFDGSGPVPADHWVTVVTRWIEGLEWHRSGDRHRVRLELAPAHLGPIHVEVAGDGSLLAARITVFHPDTLALVQRHLDDLRQALMSRGYTLTGLEVGLGGGSGSGQPGPGDPGHHGGPHPRWAGVGGLGAAGEGVVAASPGGGPGRAGPGWGRLDVRI